MSNRRVTSRMRAKKRKLACRKCKSTEVSIKEYRDAYLYICQRCSFPWRKKKGKRGVH